MMDDLTKVVLGGVAVVLAVAVTGAAVKLGWWAIPAVLGCVAVAAVGTWAVNRLVGQ